MDYEKAYKETIGKLRKLHNDWDSTQNCAAKEIELVFPELRESEDERIKSCIEMCLTDVTEQRFKEFNTTLKDCIAWLKKQGEQKTEIEYVYPKFRIGDVIEPIKPNGFYTPVRVLSIEKKTKSYYCESDDHKHYSSIPVRCENEYKLVEQKPSWSEEDEERLMRTTISFLKDFADKGYENAFECIDWIKSCRTQPKQEWSEEDEKMFDKLYEIFYRYGYSSHPEIDLSSNEAINLIHWLKSLRPQSHWKPSKEQLEALWNAIPRIPNSEKDIDVITELSTLYECLENL